MQREERAFRKHYFLKFSKGDLVQPYYVSDSRKSRSVEKALTRKYTSYRDLRGQVAMANKTHISRERQNNFQRHRIN